MIFKQSKSIHTEQDLIIPVKKGKLNANAITELTQLEGIDFTGDFADFQTLYTKQGRRLYLLGIGEEKDSSRLHEAFRKFAFKTGKNWKEKIQLDAQILDLSSVEQAVLGIEMASYQIGSWKSDKDQDGNSQEKTIITIISQQDLADKIQEGELTGETTNRIKALVDAPSNYKTPEFLARWAMDSSKQFDYDCNILDKKTLEKEGFNALLAVGRGSIHEPRLIIVSHLPRDGKAIDIGLVGKGITFDTGGLSIKPSQNMHYMKSEMGGAAAVLGAVELAARLKLNINIIGVVASAENAVDANSIRPGDVIDSYSGKTIEIIDTDAEGRLVLADALSFIIRNHNPEKLIDLATLTGSVVRTLGFSAAGMFTKNEDLSKSISEIGESIHERVWPLPMYDDFEEDLHSDIADIRNFSGKPIAGGITAAKFLEAFTESHKNWVHLDIAGMAFGSSDYAKMKSASGYGVRLIVKYLKSIENKL